jgi:hypothetical protein
MKMPIDIKLERGVRGYNIVRTKARIAVVNLSSRFIKTKFTTYLERDYFILKKMLFAAKSV